MVVLIEGALFVGASVLVVLLVHVVVRRFVPLNTLQEHHEVAGILMGLIGGIYGVLLAFIVVAVWDDFEHARRAVGIEAGTAANLFRLGEGLPVPEGFSLRADVLAYFDRVVSDEWPLLAEGQGSPAVQRILDNMWHTVTQFLPQNDRERNLQLTALNQLDELSALRRERLVFSMEGIPELIWAVLIVGGVITLGFINFFGVRHPRSEALMVFVVALLVALVIFAVYSLDYPFRGALRVPPDGMVRVRELLPATP